LATAAIGVVELMKISMMMDLAIDDRERLVPKRDVGCGQRAEDGAAGLGKSKGPSGSAFELSSFALDGLSLAPAAGRNPVIQLNIIDSHPLIDQSCRAVVRG
jgi:hypothetical protein